jgi:anthranilate/para-aminobenzoate synthase component I
MGKMLLATASSAQASHAFDSLSLLIPTLRNADPLKIIKTGPEEEHTGDPMSILQKELALHQYVKIPEIPTFTGGAIGYVSYDCIQHFEPRTACELSDPLGIPEAVFMLVDTLLIYDHLFQTVKVVSHVFCPKNAGTVNLAFVYQTAVSKARRLAKSLLVNSTPEPLQPPITLGNKSVSNVGKEGYEAFVTTLKKHIVAGDIIQAVPSQRLARPTSLNPFNAYRHLRQVNPSPYMFYLDCGGLQIVGASPETLCKVQKNVVFNHAIAGTTKRGKTLEGIYLLQIHLDSISQLIRGRETGGDPFGFRQRSSRAHHAPRPREKRRKPCLQAGNGQSRPPDETRKIQPCHPPHFTSLWNFAPR